MDTFNNYPYIKNNVWQLRLYLYACNDATCTTPMLYCCCTVANIAACEGTPHNVLISLLPTMLVGCRNGPKIK